MLSSKGTWSNNVKGFFSKGVVELLQRSTRLIKTSVDAYTFFDNTSFGSLGRPVVDRPRFSNSHLHWNLVEKLLMKEIIKLCKKWNVDITFILRFKTSYRIYRGLTLKINLTKGYVFKKNIEAGLHFGLRNIRFLKIWTCCWISQV